jgi:hypothetical protein
MGTQKTIDLSGNGIRREALSAAGLTPGHVVERTSADLFQKHSAAKGIVAPFMVAVEDDLQGKDVDDAYGSGVLVQANVLRAGDEANVFLAAGENVVIGDKLESDGAGCLQKYTNGVVEAVAREAKDLTASGAVATKINIEVV